MFRFALIGCGRIAEVGHAPGLKPFLGKELQAVAVVDPNEGRRNALGDVLGVPADSRYAEYSKALERDDIDFVDLALPHHIHEEVTIAAAQAKKNIVSEKPLSTNIESAKRIAAAVRQAGIIFVVIHNYHHIPRIAAARAAIAEGRIGKPFRLREEGAGFGYYAGKSEDPAWRTRRDAAGGGCVLDMSYHSFYGAEALMQSPFATVSAAIGTYVQEWDVEDTAAMIFTHESGAITTIQIAQSVASGGTRVHEIYGSEGTIRLTGSGQAVAEIYENSKQEWQPLDVHSNGSGFTKVFEAAIKALNGESQPLFTLEAALHNLAIVESVYAAARDKRVVEVAEIEKG